MKSTGIIQREFLAALRNSADILNPLVFLFLAVMLFAVASPVQDVQRANYGAAILWLLVLLTNMLSLDSLFRRDFESGVLEQILVSANVPFIVILVRIFVQWLSTGLLLALLSPLLCVLLGIPAELSWIAAASILLGTPAISLIGAIGAALTVGFSRGGVLLGVLVLPLFLPVLIFGASVISDQVGGVNNTAQLYWLGFMSMLALTLAPFATLAGLKISLQMQ